MPNDKTNEYYQRQNESDPFTLARGDAIEAELDAIQVGFDHLPSPRTDGTKGYVTPFTVVEPTKDEHPAQKQQVDAVESKNTNQDGRLDNIENVLAGGFVTANRYTTLRYLATQDQTEIILPTSFGELAFLHVNGLRKFPNGIGFSYDVSGRKVTLTQTLALNDEVLIDVGMIPDALLADLISIQNDITTKHGNVSEWKGQVDTWQKEVSTNKDTVLAAKQITVDAKDEIKTTHALLQKLHLGSHSSAPTKDNDGNPFTEGASYYNSTDGKAYVYESGAWVITNLSALTTVAKTSPTGKAHLPVGTTDQAGSPDKGAVRFDDDEQMLKVGDGSEWRPLGGGGVPDFVVKNGNFNIERRKAFAFDMSDDVQKTATVPNGLDNNSWFAVTTLNWTGNDGVYCYVTTIDEEWNEVEGHVDSSTRRIRISQNVTVFFQKINGKWSVVDGIGIGGGVLSTFVADSNEPFMILDDKTTSPMFMVDGGKYLWDMNKANFALSKMPIGAPDGAKVTVGDANESASILKPIGIAAGIPINGKIQTIYITNSNTVLTFEKINDVIGWKIVDGIGEGQNDNHPYEEVIILPFQSVVINGTITLPDGYTWSSFHHVDWLAGSGQVTFGTATIDASQLATPFDSRLRFADPVNLYEARIVKASDTTATISNTGSVGINSIVGYTKFKPVMPTTYPTPWVDASNTLVAPFSATPNGGFMARWIDKDTYQVAGTVNINGGANGSAVITLPSVAKSVLLTPQNRPCTVQNNTVSSAYLALATGSNLITGQAIGGSSWFICDTTFILKSI